ncbi:hypothetical protein [Frankia sp. CcWB3]
MRRVQQGGGAVVVAPSGAAVGQLVAVAEVPGLGDEVGTTVGDAPVGCDGRLVGVALGCALAAVSTGVGAPGSVGVIGCSSPTGAGPGWVPGVHSGAPAGGWFAGSLGTARPNGGAGAAGCT